MFTRNRNPRIYLTVFTVAVLLATSFATSLAHRADAANAGHDTNSVNATSAYGANATDSLQATPSTLQEAFAAAADEFGVPESVLLSVAYNVSRWDHHDGSPSTTGGYGVMHLTQVDVPPAANRFKGDASGLKGDESSQKSDSRSLMSDARSGTDHADKINRDNEPRSASLLSAPHFHTLDKAASLLGINPEHLKRDPVQNIRGGAALLAAYARETVRTVSDDPADWYGAVAKYSGSDVSEVARDFADRVFETIQTGVAHTVPSGEHVVLAAQTVEPKTHTAKRLNLQPMRKKDTDCPKGLNCQFIPAAYKLFSDDPTNYGNYDLANRPQDGQDIRYLIIHDTEGSFESAVNWFQAQSYASAQYVIKSSNGQVAQMVKLNDVAWQAGNWYFNTHSIGIEHEGYALDGTWYSEQMYHASAKLVKYLAKKYNIPLDRDHVLGHDNVPGTSPKSQTGMHWDPGPYWDWAHYFRLLGAPLERPHLPPGHPKQRNIVTINPKFKKNKPPLTYKGEPLQPQPSNFVYLYTEPRFDAPYISDPAIQPDGRPGTTEANDWGNKAVAGQRFYKAEQRGNWTAVFYGGQKAWFHNPKGKNAVRGKGMLITPKEGRDSIPVYGTAWPEDAAYDGTGIPESGRGNIAPLQYTIPAGQFYPAIGPFTSDYYYAKLYNDLEGNKVVRGKDEYYQISFNHRVAFVKKSDVRVIGGGRR
ncbi:N-acetylmuramoyl-L-alanine amidase [Numidum massiliense]|uniref:N-acetylmuramoyl-L-alanine amidase n=1 Tax=Numidum massiliense TaxID=1522315 RepID=UPI0006D537F4|nr:peptidoglycan recognition family protein [Numidum massiliense]